MTRPAGRRPFHAVLLAGGSGTRFWPLSRAHRPKQFLALGGSEPLLVMTWRRVRRLAPAERIWVVTSPALARRVRAVLPQLLPSRLILEPSPRNTAPAIGLACEVVRGKDSDAIVGVFPTDHLIRNPVAFVRSVRAAIVTAGQGALVCLGIRPDRPATGFGYLRCAERPVGLRAVRVERFVEKPRPARARAYVRSGRYLWNGGVFVGSAERFLEALGRHAPAILLAARATAAGRRGAWVRAPKLSLDYAVMEKAKNVRVVLLNAGWEDVGSWDAAARLREATRESPRDVVRIASDDSAVFGDSRLVALVGVRGLIVVDTRDALLVLSRERSGEVRRVVEELKRRGRGDLL